MMSRLASNKAFNGIKGLAGKIRRPALPEMIVGASLLGIGAALWGGMRGANKLDKAKQQYGYGSRR